MKNLSITFLCLGLFHLSFANLSIETQKPEQVTYQYAKSGNASWTSIHKVSLKFYLSALFSGYKIVMDQTSDQEIEITKVKNHTPDILSAIAQKYQLNFDIDHHAHEVIVSPIKNISSESYQTALKYLDKSSDA